MVGVPYAQCNTMYQQIEEHIKLLRGIISGEGKKCKFKILLFLVGKITAVTTDARAINCS